MRSSPWLQQRRSESAPPAQRPRDPPSISAKDQDESTERLLRPTESALYRQSLYWKLDSFMDKGFHSWSKMDLFSDCKRCMWGPHGSIKSSCKIRPNDVTQIGLPPLSGQQCVVGDPIRSSLQTPLISTSMRTGRSRNPVRASMRYGVSTSNGHRTARGETSCSVNFPISQMARSATQYSINAWSHFFRDISDNIHNQQTVLLCQRKQRFERKTTQTWNRSHIINWLKECSIHRTGYYLYSILLKVLQIFVHFYL